MLSKKQTASTKGQPSSLRRGRMSVMVDETYASGEKVRLSIFGEIGRRAQV